MLGKGKGRPGLSGDSLLNSTLWELAELLAEIAAEDGKPASEANKNQPNDSTNAAGEATTG